MTLPFLIIRLKISVIILSITLILSSCMDQTPEEKLGNLMKGNQIGFTEDVWLEKRVWDGSWTRVALFFGYVGDYETCEDMSNLYVLKYPLAKYRCTIAN
ncbi:MAG: hypothetical protein OIF56_08770 [Cohaesibacter sp.]|nr:hypothetical protein [Cohaesibacter sp.]MCV6601421.1 hypothetical protein [Cohaesibacter sp.]